MNIQVGDLVEWIEPDSAHDIGIVLGFDYRGYPCIWWTMDQDFGHCNSEYIGEHLFVIGGSHECR